jgi:hypothetical protein
MRMSDTIERFHDSNEYRNDVRRCQPTKRDKIRQLATDFNPIEVGGEPRRRSRPVESEETGHGGTSAAITRKRSADDDHT